MLLIAHDQPGSDIRNHTGRKIHTARCIQRDCNHSTQHAAEKRRDPLGGVCAPKQNAFAGLILALLSLRDPSRKGARVFENAAGKIKVERIPLSAVSKYFLQNKTALLSLNVGMGLAALAAYGTSAWGITFLR